jgi:hypothetical protein
MMNISMIKKDIEIINIVVGGYIVDLYITIIII